MISGRIDMTKEPTVRGNVVYDHTQIGDSLFWGTSHVRTQEYCSGPSNNIRLQNREFGVYQYGFMQVCGRCLNTLVMYSRTEGAITVWTG